MYILLRFRNYGSKSQAVRGGGGSASGRMPGGKAAGDPTGAAARAGGGAANKAGACATAAQAIMQSSTMRCPLSPSGMGWPVQCAGIAVAPCPAIAWEAPIRPNGATVSAKRTRNWTRRRLVTGRRIGFPGAAGKPPV
jgi:hypothetical protein